MEEPLEPPCPLPGQLLDRDLRHEVQIDFWSAFGDLLAQQEHPFRGGEWLHGLWVEVLDEATKVVQPVMRDHPKAGPDDAGLDLGVQQYRKERVLKSRDKEQLVGKGILGSP